jgi:DnaK suppressor protein
VNKTAAKRASAPARTTGRSATPAKASAAPARRAPAKPAAKPAPGPAKKPAAKPIAKPAAKPKARPATKPAAKPATKPAARPAAKPAARPTTKPIAKPASKAPIKTVPPTPRPSPAKPLAAKPQRLAAAKTPPAPPPSAKAVADAAAAVPRAPAATPAPPPTRMTSSAKSKASAKAQAAYAAPAPMPIPTSRFADRFAPPRPPTRQMSHLEIDSPKHKQKSDPKLVNAWKTKAGRDLTEAELLAMPDSEYMNEKQLEYFRGTLQHLKDDLLSNADETTEHLREDTSIVPDPADRATIEEEHALELRTRDRERKLLKKITQSLARIESGDYGFCDETGEPIGLGRLLARPTATLSLEAQQRRELKQKMFGD